MPTVAEIIGDPDFAKLSAHDRVSALRKLKGPEIAAAYFDTIPPAEMMGTVPGEDNEQITPQVANTRAMTGLGVASLAAGAVPFAAHGLMGGLAATGAGLVGSGLGAKAGRFVGSGVDEATGGLTEGYGAKVGGVIGGLVGGGYAGVKGPAALGTLLKFTPHGGPLAAVARAMIPEVAANPALSARIAHTLTREAPAAVEAAGEALGASRMAPGASQAARALEGAGLSPELATAEAGKMASATGEVSANLPGVMTPARGTPALKMPAIALSEDIQAQVATLRASGLSKAQITAAVRETHNLEPGAAGKVVDTIFEHSGPRPAATTEALPAGSKVMPPYRGGKAQPSMGPARVPANDQDLMSLLQGSIDAYRLK